MSALLSHDDWIMRAELRVGLGTRMNINRALELAAQAWTTNDTSHIEMDAALAGAFADILVRETAIAGSAAREEVDKPQLCCTDWHEKPPSSVRSINDALASAEQDKDDFRHLVQVLPSDWDKVILADALVKTREELAYFRQVVLGLPEGIYDADEAIRDCLRASERVKK